MQTNQTELLKVRIELTANHMGHFEFRLCPNNNPAKPATQACLDRFSTMFWHQSQQLLFRYLLEQSNGVGPNYFPGPGNRVFETQYQVVNIFIYFQTTISCFQLPKDLTCAQCVFQWRYIAANNWGEFSFLCHQVFFLDFFFFLIVFLYIVCSSCFYRSQAQFGLSLFDSCCCCFKMLLQLLSVLIFYCFRVCCSRLWLLASQPYWW